MQFFEAVQRRRSIRKYTERAVPADIVERAIDAALIAPNSSNMQTWQIYWVRTPEKKAKLVEFCFSQGAAKTAQELFVFVADRSQWKKSRDAVLANFGPNPPKFATDYYGKLMPFLYGLTWLAPFKWLIFNLTGLVRPIARKPWSIRDIEEVCIKSCALACENFMLAIAAQGFDSCPMEGFDEKRVKKLLRLPCKARVVMCISVGERDPKGVWGEQFRRPKNEVFFQV